MKKTKLLILFLAANIMLSNMSTISYANTATSIDVLDEAADSITRENTEIALNHSDVTDTSITVSWNAVANAKSYTIACNESIVAEGIIDNMYNITDLQPGSEVFVSVNAYDVSGVLLSSSEETIFHTSLTVNSNVTLTQNLTVENLYINDATLDLNGHSVIVENDTVMTEYSSKIIGGSGNLHINRDLRLENISNENSYVYGLEMTDPKGSVYVERNIELLSRTGGTLSAGKLELSGNININTNVTGFYNSFNTIGSHRLILSGRDTQTITLPQNSKLNIVEVKNFSEGGVFFVNRVAIADLKDNGCKVIIASEEDQIGWTLNEDETYDGNLYLAAGMLDLNGHKLTVTGDILQSGGTVFVNGGELDIHGDYKLQPSDNVNNGILNMTNSADIVRITGDFIMQSIQSHNGKLSAGIMEIGGDIIQVGGYNDNLNTTGEHTIILNGTSMQTVKFSSAGKNYSRINNLRIENTSDEGVVFSSVVYVVGNLYNTDAVILNSANIHITSETNFVNKLWNYDITVSESATINDVVIGGNLYIDSLCSIRLGGNVRIKQSLYIDGGIALNGYELNVDGDVWLDSQLLMNRGTLNIDGDFNVVNQNNSDKSSGYITMKYNEDHISVDGDMLFCAGNNYSEFTAGPSEIKGNFTQI
ncbi:MAG: fibronectin type III domain-containing protein, partial [Oscillospiraceae bacterium]|nr:fibronectin type III domain-containing protein [Oscillospiraceae bacterium]